MGIRWVGRSRSWSRATIPTWSSALVLSGTAQHWQEDELRRAWRAMPFVGLGLSLAPGYGWRVALNASA